MSPDTETAKVGHHLEKAGAERSPVDAAKLVEEISRAATLLPPQGPIGSFAFLNTLQGLEHLPFDEGLQHGARLYRAQPYLPEERYREMLSRQRIRVGDLDAVLRQQLDGQADQSIVGLCSRFELQLTMLKFPLLTGTSPELRWVVAQTDALTTFRADLAASFREQMLEDFRRWVMRDLRAPDLVQQHGAGDSWSNYEVCRATLAQFSSGQIESWTESRWSAFFLLLLWRICLHGARHVVESFECPPSWMRHRDFVLASSGQDSDAWTNELLGPFCAAFVDQGFASWSLPNRHQGLWHAFLELRAQKALAATREVRELTDAANRLLASGTTAIAFIGESLEVLGIKPTEREAYFGATLLAMRGWAGILWQLETRPDRAVIPVPAGTLVEYLAVRLLLERTWLKCHAELLPSPGAKLHAVREHSLAVVHQQREPKLDQRAFRLFQLAQLCRWSPQRLLKLTAPEWRNLFSEIEAFGNVKRRQVFHAAFERRFRCWALDALHVHTQARRVMRSRPAFQVICCIDAREESFRRHLEETAPEGETFGTAGFFGIPVYFRGIADAYFKPLCPIVIRPRHWLTEEVVYGLEAVHERRAWARRAVGTASHQVHVGSRTIAGGALLTAALGPLASIPLVARILFPTLTAKLRRSAAVFVDPPSVTRLHLERTGQQCGPDEDEVGFKLAEMIDMAERALRDMGLTRNFAPIVLLLGHGSQCMNNPHESAYACGACSGNAGGANARALAAMLNDHRVRAQLAERGLRVPDDTYFVGGLHNTCNDSIQYFDLPLMPSTIIRAFKKFRETMELVCERNSHERCRQFDSAPLDLSLEAARQHVEARAEDLAQTRPEYGNASNAMCVVGRRERTRGLFLGRRSFLMSYDATQDDELGSTLQRVLGAVVPVCAGINLQYTLSAIDTVNWGCGSKLPHNVTSLLGVMEGAASDLRPGLPLQGVEIHEPMRLLFVIETTEAVIRNVMQQNQNVAQILQNGWAQLALLDPESHQLLFYQNDRFVPYQAEISELPTVACSLDWYRGWRHHLGFAVVQDEASLTLDRPARTPSGPDPMVFR